MLVCFSIAGKERNYRSMYDTRNARYELEIEKEQAKVLERRLRLRGFNDIGGTTETSNDAEQDKDVNKDNGSDMKTPRNNKKGEMDTTLDHEAWTQEGYVTPIKRPRGRPKRKLDDRYGVETKNLNASPEGSAGLSSGAEKKSSGGKSRPLRVVLGENSKDHIKIKFVNVRSARVQEGGENGATPPQPRRRGRPPKSSGKHKNKTKNEEPPRSPEPPTLEAMPLQREEKENDSDYEDYVQVRKKFRVESVMLYCCTQARSQGGGRWGRSPPPPPKKMGGKGGGGREREKENKVACMHVKLPPFNHFQSKIKYKFVLYVENTGHMHQIAPLTTSKCKKLSLWEGEHPPPTPSPLARSARSGSVASLPSHVIFTAPPKIKSWLRHWLYT